MNPMIFVVMTATVVRAIIKLIEHLPYTATLMPLCVICGFSSSTSVALAGLGLGLRKGVRIKTPLYNCREPLELIRPCFWTVANVWDVWGG